MTESRLRWATAQETRALIDRVERCRTPKRPNTIRAVLEGHDEVGCDYCDDPLCPAACEGYDPYAIVHEDEVGA